MLADSRYSMLVIPAVVILILIYQYLQGARIVYFLPDYPVTKSASDLSGGGGDPSLGPYDGFEKCDFYGSCLALDNGENLNFVQPLLVVLLGYFAFMSGRERMWRRKIQGALFVSILYIIISYLQSLDWFFRCYEYCGYEYFILWVPLTILYILGIGIRWYMGKKGSFIN